MKSQVNYFGWQFWLHLPLIIIANLSFILVPWWLVMIGAFVLWVQFMVFGGCVLTHSQFGKDDPITFYGAYLEKLGVRVDQPKLKRYMQTIHPWVIVVLSLTIQIGLDINPILLG